VVEAGVEPENGDFRTNWRRASCGHKPLLLRRLPPRCSSSRILRRPLKSSRFVET